jgi:hypothetical protein
MTALTTLAAHIDCELECSERCTVYEFELIRLWPLNEMDREAKNAAFSREHGFHVQFYRMGWCAVFNRAS